MDHVPAVPVLGRAFGKIEAQTGLTLLRRRPVAAEAVFAQDRADVAVIAKNALRIRLGRRVARRHKRRRTDERATCGEDEEVESLSEHGHVYDDTSGSWLEPVARPTRRRPHVWLRIGTVSHLTNEETMRYSRHLIMPEVGLEGQERLKAAKVLIVGVGGLGSPAALYLAAAGIGTIGLIDFDVVDTSNLQRQILYGTTSVGHSKIAAATARIQDINPHIDVIAHETFLTSENALETLGGYDVVLDGTDNFPTRYLVNDACVLLGKPNVYGSIFRFDGQSTVFAAPGGPCYRCLFPEPPPPGTVQSCAEGGVLGILPGVIGVIQATEAVKLVLAKGKPLVGRLLMYDALAMTFTEIQIARDPDCPACGDRPSLTGLIDYPAFCGVGAAALGPDGLSVTEFEAWRSAGRDFVLLDVREPHEFQINRIPGSRLIPLRDLPGSLLDLDPEAETVIHCLMGSRSAEAVLLLRAAGFRKVHDLQGGIRAWIETVRPDMPNY
ncbi:MAG: molybdopterin-synthase adenylyltransferase MoeB [Armatimonadetes bacterium]|nr:molybdopterin-synthase adenylyltransferase MoeB [Armatimonadota bacterium]